MYQAITTKYLAPTNHRGSRIKVKCNAIISIVEWDHELSEEQNHESAARYVFMGLGWDEKNKLVGGALPSNEGYCFVQVKK